jgi:hypothetical protein
MIPSNRWFPTNLPERAAFYLNFTTQFTAAARSLGLDGYTPALEKDNAVIQFLANIYNQIAAFQDAARQYRKIITESPLGQTVPEFPPMPNFALPFEIPTGMFERLVNLRTKIMAADNYTDEIGALLGILPKSADSLTPAEVKPTIQVSPAQTGYLFSVVVGNRAEADSWEVLVRRAGQEKWAAAKTATGKSVDVVIEPAAPDRPERIQTMVQLKKNNANYGQSSDIVYVTVNP